MVVWVVWGSGWCRCWSGWCGGQGGGGVRVVPVVQIFLLSSSVQLEEISTADVEALTARVVF